MLKNTKQNKLGSMIFVMYKLQRLFRKTAFFILNKTFNVKNFVSF